MMNRKFGWASILIFLALASCGGEGPGLADLRNGPIGETPGGGTSNADLNSVELLTSSPQMQSDGSTIVTLSAFAKNANNQVVAGVPVVFSASSGTLVVVEGTTNAQGIATAELTTTGDPTNRSITVTATVGELSDTVDVDVIGSALQIQGPVSLVLDIPATYTITLLDSAGSGIANRPITVTSANGNPVPPTSGSLTTDANGQVEVELTASASGKDTLTATALPDAEGNPTVTASFTVNVSADNFRFIDPESGTEIPLDDPATTTTIEGRDITLRWLDENDVPQDGEVITFSPTRGAISPTSATTNADGEVTVQVSSDTAGPATITATADSDGTSTQLVVEFVATDPDQLFMKTDPGVIGPNGTSTITATVEDPVGNLVKNATVTFTLTDTTGGSLSVGSAVTNSAGEAQTIYTASSATSAEDGVIVTGRVKDTALQTETTLTVSGRALSMIIGTGNDIIESNEGTTYTKVYTLIVRDSSGAGVPDQTANIGILSTHFYKGFLVPGTTHWFRPANAPRCEAEDQDSDGVLDVGEDVNTDGELTPGGVAIVAPGTVTTDETGVATFEVIYPQDHAMWAEADITATATVAGTESLQTAIFDFPASAEDLTVDGSPPNPDSPWGTANGAFDTTTGTVTFDPAPGTCANTD